MKLQRNPRQRGDTLALARELARADLVTFAERLDAVGRRLAGAAVISHQVAEHHRAALRAHQVAEASIPVAGTTEELVTAVGDLAAGRLHLAHVEAYVTGEAAPAERAPCLFDPAHGPSVTDAAWTSVRYGTRRVPACLHDAVMLSAGVPPDRRTVDVEGRRVAYWEAGEEALPYLVGYFPGHPLLSWMRDPGNRLPRGVLSPPGIYGDPGNWCGFGL